MKVIDLRSDTFTLPTEGMRRAIFEAPVGNAGYGEDPSVNALEEEIAAFFGQEAALFLPSATMAGQIAISVWSRPGDVVIIESFGHNHYYETGSMSLISGVQAHTIDGRRGILDPADVAAALESCAQLHARVSLVVIENTTNFGGGAIYPQTTLDRIFELARERSLPVHVDGARIWNAIAATGADPRRMVQPGGSISVCMSKGLGAPMGALLAGPGPFIAEARRVQSMLGGVMRQVGFMAAAARYGFGHHRARLHEDHAHAAMLADRLAASPALTIDREGVQTNIVWCGVNAGAVRAALLVSALERAGVKVLAVGARLRLVTSLNVSRADCEAAAGRILKLLEKA